MLALSTRDTWVSLSVSSSLIRLFTKYLLYSFNWKESLICACISSSNKDMRTPAPVLTQTISLWSVPVCWLLSPWHRVCACVCVCTCACACSCHPGEMTLSSHSGSFRQRGDTAGMQVHWRTERTPYTFTLIWVCVSHIWGPTVNLLNLYSITQTCF